MKHPEYTAHSPGPWRIEYDEDGRARRIVADDDEHVVYVQESRYCHDETLPDPEQVANIQLLNASPCLLAALEESIAFLESILQELGPHCEEEMVRATVARGRAAIEKASKSESE